MNQFYQKEIGGILGAILVSASPVFAHHKEYQEGYSETTTCFKEQYREEYVPGTADSPGYIKSWTDTIEYPCSRTYEEYDENDCSDGKIAGMLLGGAAGAAMSRGDGRWWAIPLGAVVGSGIGCDIDGG